jgi:hypothetical protein
LVTHGRFRVSVGELLEMRRVSRLHYRGFVGLFVGGVLDVFTFAPMLFLARVGLLYAHSRESRLVGYSPVVGPDADGGAGSGVGARLPTIPPSLGGKAAKNLPD